MIRRIPGRLLHLLVVWSIVWPCVMIGFVTIERAAPDLPFAVRTMVLTGGLVPTIALLISPLATRIVNRIS